MTITSSTCLESRILHLTIILFEYGDLIFSEWGKSVGGFRFVRIDRLLVAFHIHCIDRPGQRLTKPLSARSLLLHSQSLTSSLCQTWRVKRPENPNQTGTKYKTKMDTSCRDVKWLVWPGIEPSKSITGLDCSKLTHNCSYWVERHYGPSLRNRSVEPKLICTFSLWMAKNQLWLSKIL